MKTKQLLSFLLLCLSLDASAQQNNDLATEFAYEINHTNKDTPPEMPRHKRSLSSIFSQGDGTYLGISNGIKFGHYALGAQLKQYTDYYTLLAGYINYDYIFDESKEISQHTIGAGINFYCFALDLSYNFGNDANHMRIIPKIGFDTGNLSVFYGYGINLGHKTFDTYNRRQFTVKYLIIIHSV